MSELWEAELSTRVGAVIDEWLIVGSIRMSQQQQQQQLPCSGYQYVPRACWTRQATFKYIWGSMCSTHISVSHFETKQGSLISMSAVRRQVWGLRLFVIATFTPTGLRVWEGSDLSAQPQKHHDGADVRRVRPQHARVARRNHVHYVQVQPGILYNFRGRQFD